jgi:hypothetical protein
MLAPPCAQADEWTKADSLREIGFFSVGALDWSQTRQIAMEPDLHSENNQILGAHPTTGQVNRYFAAVLVAHFSIAYLLPEGIREPFQYFTIGLEAAAVTGNYMIGINGKF